jgi:hypothetical protein
MRRSVEEIGCGKRRGTELSAWMVYLWSGEVAAEVCRTAAPAAAAQPHPPVRAVWRRWLAVAVSALVMGAYAAQVVVRAAEISPAPIAGIAPSYGPKTVSAVPNAAAIVRRIWLPELDAGYDPQGLAVDNDAIYVSAYRSDSLSVRRGPCRVIHIDLETGGSTGHVDVPSPCGHAGGLAVGGDGMLYVADTHTLFATALAGAFDRGTRFRQFSLGPGVIGGLAASTPDGIWLGTYEDGAGRLFRFTAATLARLFDGETLEATQAATALIIPDHAQGAARSALKAEQETRDAEFAERIAREAALEAERQAARDAATPPAKLGSEKADRSVDRSTKDALTDYRVYICASRSPVSPRF